MTLLKMKSKPMEASRTTSNFNLSNILSTLRIVLSLIIPPLLITDSLSMRVLGGVIFTIAALTDYWDGMLARRYGWITIYGKIIDPIADKMLTLGTFATLSYLGLFPWWILLPILVREIGITLLRFYFLYHGDAVAAVTSGKQKTTLQIVAIYLIYFNLLFRYYAGSTLSPNSNQIAGFILDGAMWFVLLGALYQTVYSGIDFLKNNRHLLRWR